MLLEFEGLIRTSGVARAGTTVREVFEECVTHRVLGIPFVNDENEIIGRVSARHILKETCIPDHMVHGAHLLGNLIEGLLIPDEMIDEILEVTVDDLVIPVTTIVDSAAPLVKVLSIMEQQNTPYIFVVDDGEYRGMITRMSCIEVMLKIADA